MTLYVTYGGGGGHRAEAAKQGLKQAEETAESLRSLPESIEKVADSAGKIYHVNQDKNAGKFLVFTA